MITTQVTLPGENAEAGLCGRINATGSGYCLGTAWGGRKALVLSYFGGYPFNPGYIAGTLIEINYSEPVTMKLLFNDSLIMGKAFNTGYTEPDWQVQAADTRYSTGHAGYYTYYSRAEFYSTNTTQT